MTDVVSTLRDTNMRKRRERILHAARTLIATDGFEALNVRALAAAAGNSTVAIRDYRSSR